MKKQKKKKPVERKDSGGLKDESALGHLAGSAIPTLKASPENTRAFRRRSRGVSEGQWGGFMLVCRR